MKIYFLKDGTISAVVPIVWVVSKIRNRSQMEAKLRNILEGIASTLELFPRTNYRKFLTSTREDLVCNAWVTTGKMLESALELVAVEIDESEKDKTIAYYKSNKASTAQQHQ